MQVFVFLLPSALVLFVVVSAQVFLCCFHSYVLLSLLRYCFHSYVLLSLLRCCYQGFIQDYPLRGGDRGQGGVGSNCRVAFFRDLEKVIDSDDKQRTKLKSLLISKISSGAWGGGGGGGI